MNPPASAHELFHYHSHARDKEALSKLDCFDLRIKNALLAVSVVSAISLSTHLPADSRNQSDGGYGVLLCSTTSTASKEGPANSRSSNTVSNTTINTPPARAKRSIRPLPGGLNETEVVNSNSPEVVLEDGILLSTYPPQDMRHPQAHLDHSVQGRFEVFYHHIADGIKSGNLNDLHIGVLIGNRGANPVKLKVLDCATYTSQPDAPFMTLPALVSNDAKNVYAGPGDRCTLDFLTGQSSFAVKSKKTEWTIEPGQDVLVFDHEIPVSKLQPPLNGRNFMASLTASGPVNVAVLSTYKESDRSSVFKQLLTEATLVTPREKPASAPEQKGPMIYGRVSGVSVGSQWLGKLADPDSETLSLPREEEPVAYVISSLAGGTFSSGQIETAKLRVRYPDTAYASHGNYGVRYLLPVELENNLGRAATVSIALESPLKSNTSNGFVEFLDPPGSSVTFRGSLKLTEENTKGQTASHFYHYVLKRGENGTPFANFNIEPGKRKKATIELYYPADCTPPQLLTVSTTLR